MTPAQRRLARHALGLKPCPFCGDAMENARGVLRHTKRDKCLIGALAWPIEWDDRWKTRAGAEAALDPGETLNQEDFSAEEPSAIACVTCCGNGEIITDWDAYLHPPKGADAAAGTADCPTCDGIGTLDPEDFPEAEKGAE